MSLLKLDINDASFFVTDFFYNQNDIDCIYSESDVRIFFNKTSGFVLSSGSPKLRSLFHSTLVSYGGTPISVVAKSSQISSSSKLSLGLNIMHNVYIGPDVIIGEGSLINSFSSVHHDAEVGEFVEIAPGARILGSAKIGDQCFIGTNSVICPNVSIGENSKIGAGVVVKKDIPADSIITS